MNKKTLVKVNLNDDIILSFPVEGYTAGCGHTTYILETIDDRLPKLGYFSKLVEIMNLNSEEYKGILVFNFISEGGFNGTICKIFSNRGIILPLFN